MLTMMNGPELLRIRTDKQAKYIYTHLVDYYNESLYGGWIYYKRGQRKKNADGTKKWPPLEWTKVVPSAVFDSPSSRLFHDDTSNLSPISAHRHIVTKFHLPIKKFPELPKDPKRDLTTSVDRRAIDRASKSRGRHQPSTTPASALAWSSASAQKAVTASRQNKRKCTPPPNDPHTAVQRHKLRRSCHQQGSLSKGL
jgi:hypothetical protein